MNKLNIGMIVSVDAEVLDTESYTYDELAQILKWVMELEYADMGMDIEVRDVYYEEES